MALPSLGWQNIKAVRKQHGWLLKGWRKHKSTPPSSTWESNATGLQQKRRLQLLQQQHLPLDKGQAFVRGQAALGRITMSLCGEYTTCLLGYDNGAAGEEGFSSLSLFFSPSLDKIPRNVCPSSWGWWYSTKVWCQQDQSRLWVWQQCHLFHNTRRSPSTLTPAI